MFHLAFLGLLCVNQILAEPCAVPEIDDSCIDRPKKECCVNNGCEWTTAIPICNSAFPSWSQCCSQITDEPTTSAPTTSPTTNEPTTSAPTTSSPTTSAPTTNKPTTYTPTTSTPTTSSPTTSEPTTSSPTTSEPTTSVPTTNEPTTSAPTTNVPTTSEPTTNEPTTSAPTTSSPTTNIPTTSEPTTSTPTTNIPTSSAPTTSSPTTSVPTTNIPTTSEPTTNNPTTNVPTTHVPTTNNPTTSAPSTNVPTTSEPTTSTPTPASNAQICPKQGRVCNKAGECCSKHGWCGTTPAYCNNPYDFPDCPTCPVCQDNEPDEQPFQQHCNCICYGDPHCKMWNCAMNNWQGPHGSTAPGNVYYMTRCNDVQHVNIMPFDLIASIQRTDTYFTALDYTILKLWNGNDAGTNGEQYCIKNKGNEGVTFNTDCGDIYHQTPAQNTVISIASKFEIEWKFENGYSKLYLNVLGDECANDLVVISHTTVNEEAVEIIVSECYKAFTCGMCGNFYNTGLTFERSDGSLMLLDEASWGGTANDVTGLSYFVEDSAVSHRRLQDNDMVEPCFGRRAEIEMECKNQLRKYAQCCWDRKQFCAEMIGSCGWDSCSCAMGKMEVYSMEVVHQCIDVILNASMSFVCGLDADGFVADMSIYESVGKNDVIYDDCEECDAAGYIFIGIGTASVMFVIIGVLFYFSVIKPVLNAVGLKGGVEMNQVTSFSPTISEVTNTNTATTFAVTMNE